MVSIRLSRTGCINIEDDRVTYILILPSLRRSIGHIDIMTVMGLKTAIQ